MRHKKSNSSVLETVLKSDVEKINAFGSLEKQNSINSLQSLIICWKEISTLQVPREGKMGGGGEGLQSLGYLCYPVTFAAGFHLFLFLHLSRKKTVIIIIIIIIITKKSA